MKRHHGDYQAAKGNVVQAVKYVTKHDKTPYLVNINVKQLEREVKSKKKQFGKMVIEGSNLVDLIKENPEHLFDFHNWDRAAKAYKHSTEKAYESEGARGLWLWGPKNTGKSYLAR